jgi:hypothetical protein
MAGFCTKCGSTMPSDTGFCPACGAPAAAGNVTAQPGFAPVAVPVTPPVVVAQPVPVAQPVAPAYQATPGYSQVNAGGAPPAVAGYPPATAYPAAQPAKSGGALKIILIVVAVVVGLGVIAAGVVGYGVWRVAHSVASSVHTDSKGNTTYSGLGGTISAGKDLNISAADLGVDLYPGASRAEGGMNMKMPTGSMVSAVYVTDDPVSSVVAYYKGKLGENESDVDTDNGSVLSSGKQGANGKSGTVITIAPGTGNKSGKTQISIVHTTSTE